MITISLLGIITLKDLGFKSKLQNKLEKSNVITTVTLLLAGAVVTRLLRRAGNYVIQIR